MSDHTLGPLTFIFRRADAAGAAPGPDRLRLLATYRPRCSGHMPERRTKPTHPSGRDQPGNSLDFPGRPPWERG